MQSQKRGQEGRRLIFPGTLATLLLPYHKPSFTADDRRNIAAVKRHHLAIGQPAKSFRLLPDRGEQFEGIQTVGYIENFNAGHRLTTIDYV